MPDNIKNLNLAFDPELEHEREKKELDAKQKFSRNFGNIAKLKQKSRKKIKVSANPLVYSGQKPVKKAIT